jgi:hypothetical protein
MRFPWLAYEYRLLPVKIRHVDNRTLTPTGALPTRAENARHAARLTISTETG